MIRRVIPRSNTRCATNQGRRPHVQRPSADPSDRSSSVHQWYGVRVGTTGEIATEFEHREPQEGLSRRRRRIAVSDTSERQRIRGLAQAHNQSCLFGRRHRTPALYLRLLNFRCSVIGEYGLRGEWIHERLAKRPAGLAQPKLTKLFGGPPRTRERRLASPPGFEPGFQP